jgi:uncharacterized protein (DUF1800 family)
MLTREAANTKMSRRKSAEQKIRNLLEVRAPKAIFSGKCGLRAGKQHQQFSRAREENQRYLRTMSKGKKFSRMRYIIISR